MKKIKYYYSSMSKQVFILILSFLILLRFVLFMQVTIYNINGYGGTFNVGGTIILYAIYLAVCVVFFSAYKFFYTTFDENQATYYNKLLNKKITVDLNAVTKAHLSKRGIYLYKEESGKHCFYIPFFRNGIVSPVGIDDFYKLLKQKNIQIEKDFDVLPGQGKRWKWVGFMYTGFALFALAPATQTLALVVAIFKSH